MDTRLEQDETDRYQIRVKGVLNPSWSDWFDDLTITQIDGDSLLTGRIRDQAALHGVLNKIRDLGLILVFIKPVDSKSTDDQETKCGN